MYYQDLNEAVAVKNYLRDQLGEVHERVVSFEKGHAVQRYKSGTYWEGSKWDNGCGPLEFSDYEKRHGFDSSVLG